MIEVFNSAEIGQVYEGKPIFYAYIFKDELGFTCLKSEPYIYFDLTTNYEAIAWGGRFTLTSVATDSLDNEVTKNVNFYLSINQNVQVPLLAFYSNGLRDNNIDDIYMRYDGDDVTFFENVKLVNCFNILTTPVPDYYLLSAFKHCYNNLQVEKGLLLPPWRMYCTPRDSGKRIIAEIRNLGADIEVTPKTSFIGAGGITNPRSFYLRSPNETGSAPSQIGIQNGKAGIFGFNWEELKPSCDTYVWAQWTSQFGGVRRNILRVSNVKNCVDSTNLLLRKNGHTTRMTQEIDLFIDKCSGYDVWYYSDMAAAEDLKIFYRGANTPSNEDEQLWGMFDDLAWYDATELVSPIVFNARADMDAITVSLTSNNLYDLTIPVVLSNH